MRAGSGRLPTELQAQADAAGDIDWLVSVDSTTVRAHQHAAGARRSRGGLAIRVHLAAGGRCCPWSLLVATGHRHGSVCFEADMAGIRVSSIGNGCPGTRPDSVSADRAYSSRAIRTHVCRRGITAVIPELAGQIANRKRHGSRRGRPSRLDRQAYKHRNTVGRCVNRLKQWRGVAMRTDKLAVHFGIHISELERSCGRGGIPFLLGAAAGPCGGRYSPLYSVRCVPWTFRIRHRAARPWPPRRRTGPAVRVRLP